MACVWGVRFFFFSRFKRSVGIIPDVHKSVEREIRRVLPLEMRSFFLILFITTRCICYLFCAIFACFLPSVNFFESVLAV